MEYDLLSPEFVADPYPVLARLRAQRPVFFDETTGQWVVTRYADVDALLRDRRLGRSYLHVASHEEFGREAEPDFLKPFWDLVRAGMMDVEPPTHTRLRRMVARAFTARLVEGLRPMVRRLAEELADGLADRGGGDLMAEVAEPLPVQVISEMLGVPEGDRHLLRPWSAAICGMFEPDPAPEVQQAAVAAAVEFSGYLRGLARERREDPRDDLISALAQVAEDGDRLTEDELIGTCVLLLNAGHEATVNATGNGWWALFRNPGELAGLREDEALIPSAVEELLRYDTPAPVFTRWVLEDLQEFGIPKGGQVALHLAAANRDPAVFPEPDRLDLARSPNPHLTFGLGIHFCLGAPLARIELAESYRALLRVGLTPVEEPVWKPGYVLRGLRSLHVEATLKSR